MPVDSTVRFARQCASARCLSRCNQATTWQDAVAPMLRKINTRPGTINWGRTSIRRVNRRCPGRRRPFTLAYVTGPARCVLFGGRQFGFRLHTAPIRLE